MADPGVGPAGPQAGTAVPVAMPVASGSAGPVAVSRAEMDTLRTETSGKAGAGPLGKAASKGTEATAAEAAVTSVMAVTSAPAAAVTTVTDGNVRCAGAEGTGGEAERGGSGTTPEDNGSGTGQPQKTTDLSVSAVPGPKGPVAKRGGGLRDDKDNRPVISNNSWKQFIW